MQDKNCTKNGNLKKMLFLGDEICEGGKQDDETRQLS